MKTHTHIISGKKERFCGNSLDLPGELVWTIDDTVTTISTVTCRIR